MDLLTHSVNVPAEREKLRRLRDEIAADGPRYKALGNSWAVNCARWIGRRIEAVEGIKPLNAEITGLSG